MAGRRSRSDEKGRFADLVPGVKPLSPSKRAGPARPTRTAPHRPAAAPEVRFVVERSGERVTGIAQGVDRRHLVRLRRGEVAVERRLDLHGQRRAAAGNTVRRALLASHAEGERCILVVHGRGHGSETGPVLQPSLVEWLCAPPLSPLVLAFASALPRDGGPGATYVLLRRRRR